MSFGGFILASGVANISPLFALLTLVLVLAVLISLVLVKFKQSLLVGYLLSGVLIGNFGLLWVTGVDKGSPVISESGGNRRGAADVHARASSSRSPSSSTCGARR